MDRKEKWAAGLPPWVRAVPCGRRPRRRWSIRIASLAGVCIVTVALSIGCDDVQRHKWLTVFFEGVPPVDRDFRPPASVVLVSTGGLPGGGAAGGLGGPASAQRRGSRHEPSPDCTKCHASSFQQYRRELIEPVPQLCYSCHKTYELPGNRLHGPVAVGECVFCHNPHQSGYVHLQNAPQPELCYRCHVRGDMAAIPGHETMDDTICTDCHDPHGSEREKLLKSAEASQPDPNSIDLVK